MKTSELTGNALNWAVNRADELTGVLAPVNYCGKWEHGGPIIEREKIEVFIEDEQWMAYSCRSLPQNFEGDTPLIAAMRCYVASQLGEDVEVPDEFH